MNQPIFNLHRFLTEEGVPCHVRMATSGPARLVTDKYFISHSDTRNLFVLTPLEGKALRISRPGTILNLHKEQNGTDPTNPQG